jgi:hypothetical protein
MHDRPDTHPHGCRATTGYGGLDKLEYREDARCLARFGEVLIQSARPASTTPISIPDPAGTTSRQDSTDAAGAQSDGGKHAGSGDWGSDLTFPRIQGADVPVRSWQSAPM